MNKTKKQRASLKADVVVAVVRVLAKGVLNISGSSTYVYRVLRVKVQGAVTRSLC